MSTLTVIQRHLELDDLTVERSGDGRTILARALTYGVPYEVTDDGGRTFYHEVWRSGVFRRSIDHRQGRFPVLTMHDRRRLPVGATLGIEPNDSAFIFRAKISNTRDGDEALELVRDGVLTGISVGARPLNNRKIERGVERVEAALVEISLCTTGISQMADAMVLAVRAHVDGDGDGDDGDADGGDTDTPALDEARALLEGLTCP